VELLRHRRHLHHRLPSHRGSPGHRGDGGGAAGCPVPPAVPPGLQRGALAIKGGGMVEQVGEAMDGLTKRGCGEEREQGLEVGGWRLGVGGWGSEVGGRWLDRGNLRQVER